MLDAKAQLPTANCRTHVLEMRLSATYARVHAAKSSVGGKRWQILAPERRRRGTPFPIGVVETST